MPAQCGRGRRIAPIAVWAIIAVGVVLSLALTTQLHAAANQQTESPTNPDSVIARDYRWVHFMQQPGGMTSNDVWSVVTTDNAVWIGTTQGVNRYDGVWTVFEDDPSAPVGRVRALAVGEDGATLLAGNEYGTVYRWDDELWRIVDHLDGEVLSLIEIDGSLLAGTEEGLYTISRGADASHVLSGQAVYSLDLAHGKLFAGADDGLWQFEDDEWSLVPLGDVADAGVYAVNESGAVEFALGIPDGVLILDDQLEPRYHLVTTDVLGWPALVQALASDDFGRLWAGTDGAGVYEIATATYRARAHGQSNDANVTLGYVRDIAVDADGSLWFATPSGVYRYQIGTWQLDVQGASVDDSINHVNDLLMDSQGRLWIATGGSGVRMKPGLGQREKLYTLESDGAPLHILVLEEDDYGGVWAGSFYGIFQFVDDEWIFPSLNDGLPSPVITSLLADRETLWIGTESGLARYDIPNGVISVVDEFDGMSIEAMAFDSLGAMWLGTLENGVWQQTGAGEWIQHYPITDDPASIPGRGVTSNGLAADWREPGNMWVLLADDGLVHWDGSAWSQELANNQLPKGLLWTLMTEDDPGMLWVGSEYGVTQYDGLTWGSLTQDDGLRSASAFAIEATDGGGYWIGGPAGLTFYQPDESNPWVRLEPLSESVEYDETGAVTLPVNQPLEVGYAAGDLQTLAEKLVVLARLSGPEGVGDWIVQTGGRIEFEHAVPGDYELELMSRDQAFNYSDIAILPFTVYVPPVVVHVPGLGEIAPAIFGALMVLGFISMLGGGYILFEILQRRRRSVDALNRKFNPYISGEPVRTPEMFFGRSDLVQRIVDTLHNNSVMIHGERRIGKTTLLYQLAALLRSIKDDEYWFVSVYIDLEGTPQQDFFHLLIEEIIRSVSRLPNAADEIMPRLRNLRYRTVPGPLYDDRVFHRDLHQVIDILDEYGQHHYPGCQLRLILLMDEMDVMSRYDPIVQQQLRRIFMREFAYTVGAVVAGIRISKDWDRVESPWYNLFNEIALEPFSDEDALALLIEPVDEYYRYSDDAIEFILDHSKGRPYRLQQYGLESIASMLSEGRRKVSIDDAIVAHQRIMTSAKREAEIRRRRVQQTPQQ